MYNQDKTINLPSIISQLENIIDVLNNNDLESTTEGLRSTVNLLQDLPSQSAAEIPTISEEEQITTNDKSQNSNGDDLESVPAKGEKIIEPSSISFENEKAVKNETSKNEKPKSKTKNSLPDVIDLNQKSKKIDLNDLPPTFENMEALPPKEEIEPTIIIEKMIGKNAMVDKLYSLELSEISPSVDEIIIHEIRGLEEKGLRYNKIESTITGTPVEAGEFEFKIIYAFESDSEQSFEDKTFHLLINPNPRSLWKINEPSADEIYQKPHFDFKKETFYNYSIFAGSQRGRSHAHEGIFRDDHFSIKKLSKNVFFIAVADGAGSCQYSRKGSKIACKVAKDIVKKELEEKEEEIIHLAEKFLSDTSDSEIGKQLNDIGYHLVGKSVTAARNAILEKANSKGHQPKDYSTTLLFSIIFKLKDNFFVFAYSIGDGIIAHVTEDGGIKLLSNPDGGEFAGQTRFLTMSDAVDTIAERLKMTSMENLSGLCLMTDGISDPFFETDANFNKMEKWTSLFNEMNKNVDFKNKNVDVQFGDWLNFWSPGNHDDRTIVIVKSVE